MEVATKKDWNGWQWGNLFCGSGWNWQLLVKSQWLRASNQWLTWVWSRACALELDDSGVVVFICAETWVTFIVTDARALTLQIWGIPNETALNVKITCCHWSNQTASLLATAHYSVKIWTRDLSGQLYGHLYHHKLRKLANLHLPYLISTVPLAGWYTATLPTGSMAYDGGAVTHEEHRLPFSFHQLFPEAASHHQKLSQWEHCYQFLKVHGQ